MDPSPGAQMAKARIEDMHPEQMPEARRELMIAVGAFEGLTNTVNELLARVRDFQRDVEPSSDTARLLDQPHLVVNSPYGREVRGLSDGIGELERRVRSTLLLLEL